MAECHYDEQVRIFITGALTFLQGQFFPFFVIAVLVMILAPLTYNNFLKQKRI